MSELNKIRKTIRHLFEIERKKFIIPDYQRPYAWDLEKCETLWDDLVSFYKETKGQDDKKYFLGTIVTCKNSDNNIELVDGQQRITSLLLLLRSFYKKLENMDENENEVRRLKEQIAPCLWNTDTLTGGIDITIPHIASMVATDKENDTLNQIIKNGVVEEDKKNLYIKNYNNFLKWNNQYAQDDPLSWKQLIITILDRCIIIPIECDTFDLALTIFSTLNDRGLPLSDSDVFKSKIYKNTKTNERDKFIDQWNDLNENTKRANISMDQLFRYYSHIIRAKENNRNQEKALRKFYSDNDHKYLAQKGLIEELASLCEFWVAINKREDNFNDKNIPFNAKKYLHCLSIYPNEYWKFTTSVFYHCNKNENDFSEKFVDFLKKITAFLISKFIERPSVNAIKSDIYNSCINIYENKSLNFAYNIKKEDIQEDSGASRINRCLILLHAYLDKDQKDLIDSNWEIEHIFPRRWQDTNYNGWNETDAKEYLEKLGNKIAIGKKLNIRAGNGYFGQKKNQYSQSKISVLKKLSKYPANDWTKDDIKKREEDFTKDIWSFLNTNLKI